MVETGLFCSFDSVIDDDDDESSSTRKKHEDDDKEEEEELCYFNNASQARFDAEVVQVGQSCLTNQFQDFGNVQDDIRTLFAGLIGADASNIAIMASTAFAITLAAKNLESSLTETGQILILQDQFCSAVYPWQDVCRRSRGRLSLHVVPYPNDNDSWTNLILQSLTANPVVAVCLPPLHWSDGSIIDLQPISEVCQSKNIPLLVDATQAVGAMSVNVAKLRPAVLACSSHKWLRGPLGTCLVYIDPAHHDSWVPLDQHGRGRDLGGKDWDAGPNEMDAHGYPAAFYKDARKFDSGGKANPLLLPMLRASLLKVATCDPRSLQAELEELMQPLFEWVAKNPKFTLPNNHAFHLFGIRPYKDSMSTKELLELCRHLCSHNIVVAVRCGAIRISPYNDNDKHDVEKLVAALQNASCVA